MRAGARRGARTRRPALSRARRCYRAARCGSRCRSSRRRCAPAGSSLGQRMSASQQLPFVTSRPSVSRGAGSARTSARGCARTRRFNRGRRSPSGSSGLCAKVAYARRCSRSSIERCGSSRSYPPQSPSSERCLPRHRSGDPHGLDVDTPLHGLLVSLLCRVAELGRGCFASRGLGGMERARGPHLLERGRAQPAVARR